MGKDLERDVFKVLVLGIAGVVVIKLAQQSGGVSQVVKALGGVYNDTLGTLSRT